MGAVTAPINAAPNLPISRWKGSKLESGTPLWPFFIPKSQTARLLLRENGIFADRSALRSGQDAVKVTPHTGAQRAHTTSSVDVEPRRIVMLDVTIWGSRGSIPVCGEHFVRHGGATTCLEISNPADDERVIIDCGTGLAELGKAWGSRLPRALVLQTHMHWDHIQGFPFFAQLYNPAAHFEFWAADREGQSFREVIEGQMARPTFPIGMDIMPASKTFKTLATSGQARRGAMTIEWSEMDHPSGCTGFRIGSAGASVVFSGDVEVQQGCRQALVALARGADVLVMDAQYLPEEYPQRRGFGHSTPIDAVKVALEAGAGHLVPTHHDPTHDDGRLEDKLGLARRHAAGSGLRVDNAFDGMTLRVAAQTTGRSVRGGDLATAAL